MNAIKGKIFAMLVWIGACTLLPQAAPAVKLFKISPAKNAVKFTSDAPLELIQGHGDNISGNITLADDFDFSKDFKAEFAVDLASIDTGIALRNEHMRDNFLETKKFPNAQFKVTKITGDASRFLKMSPTDVVAEGTVTIHGISQVRKIPVTVTLKRRKDTKSEIVFSGKFPVKLTDFRIKRPEIVFKKLADTVFVDISTNAVLDTKASIQ